MSTFIIQAQAATFYNAGSHQMVSVAFGAPALAYEVIEASSVDALKPHFARVKAALDNEGRPYSLHIRLAKGSRAPRGWNDRQREFRRDESFERAA
jgi:hypothetical protein